MVPLLHTLAVVTAYWCIVYSVDKFLHLYGPVSVRYAQFLENAGITVSVAHWRCYTTRLNRLFGLWSCLNRKCARAWFNAGAIVGVVLMVTSVLVLVYALYQALLSSPGNQQVLTPVMPGVNLPWSEISYYFATLVVAGVFHEVGHALAAVTEHVRINGFGVFIFFLYPGAFVDLHTDHLSVISPKRQLRIYCAGVWHNVILSLVALAILLGLPSLTLPFYSTEKGAVILGLAEGSVLEGKLQVGSAITRINSCTVFGSSSLVKCVQEILSRPQHGYCVDATVLQGLTLHANQTVLTDDGARECCEQDSQTDLCFAVLEKGQSKADTTTFTCLIARKVISESTCAEPRDCHADEAVDPESPSICIVPALGKNSYLVRIAHTGKGDPVLFVGDLGFLQYSIHITNYLPIGGAPVWLPRFLETLLTYIISISSALALLNILPAYALDGQWALGALLEFLLPEYPHREKIVSIVLPTCTVLLVLNILMALWILINW